MAFVGALRTCGAPVPLTLVLGFLMPRISLSYNCPHCNSSGIRFRQKWLSSAAFPIECSNCKKLCFAPSSRDGAVLVANCVLLTAAGFLAIALKTSIPVFAGILVAFALWFSRIHIQPLFRLSPEQVTRSRKANALDLIGLIVFSFFQ